MPTLSSFRTALATLPILARAQLSPQGRQMLAEIRQMQHSLPAHYHAQPLPDLLQSITPQQTDWQESNPEQVRKLVDALAFWDRGSPFGICLRRSLLRYHFLRRAGVPLGLVLAMRARSGPDETPGLAGHAWNTLAGQPWHERPEDRLGFTEVYRWPPEETV
jgi:hypothetical protein